jgi:hypothetical protein
MDRCIGGKEIGEERKKKRKQSGKPPMNRPWRSTNRD